MQRQFFSGNSLDQAVMAAARQFQLEPEQLAYKLRDKKHGFLGARRKVVIEVDPQAPQLAPGEMQPAKAASPIAPPLAPRPAVERRPVDEAPVRAASPSDDFEDEDDEMPVEKPAFQESRPPREGRPAAPPQRGRERRPDDRFNQDSRRGGGDDRRGRGNHPGHQRDDSRGNRAEPPRRGSGHGHSHGHSNNGHGGHGGHGHHGGGNRQDFRGRSGDSRNGGGGRFNGGGYDRQREAEKSRRTIIRRVEHRWQDRNWLQADDEGEGVSKEILAFERGIEMILDIVDIDIEFAVTEGDPFKVDFSGEDHQILIAEDGQILKSIEHILPRLVRSAVGESLTCRVDCENFQASHEESLMEMARAVASEVKASKKAKALPPMNPADRRLVHVALMEDPDVDTLSEGEGYIKRVKILPVRR